jgi:hypothetical protein
MTQCGTATIMSQKGSKFPKIELLESCKKVAEDLLLREEHHSCGSDQPARIRRCSAH